MHRAQTLRLVPRPPGVPEQSRRRVEDLWSGAGSPLHSLHGSVPYLSSTKPELPDYFIRRLSTKGEVVLDPFCGRGTTALQANLLGRIAYASDLNPLAVLMTKAKTQPVGLDEVLLRLNEVQFTRPASLAAFQQSFSPFYHSETYREVANLRSFIQRKRDRVNAFIELLAVSRLHGHTPAYLSGYSFPQFALPPDRQLVLNLRRRETPEYRAVAPRIIKKAAELLRDGFTSDFFEASQRNSFDVADARSLAYLPANSVDLVVTAPPLLENPDYPTSQWIAYWFAGVSAPVGLTRSITFAIDEWRELQRRVLSELLRVVKHDRYVVVEVPEIEVNGEAIALEGVLTAVAAPLSVSGKRLLVDEVLVNPLHIEKVVRGLPGERPVSKVRSHCVVVFRVSDRSQLRARRTPEG